MIHLTSHRRQHDNSATAKQCPKCNGYYCGAEGERESNRTVPIGRESQRDRLWWDSDVGGGEAGSSVG